jgi:cAMP phosphodiesterase
MNEQGILNHLGNMEKILKTLNIIYNHIKNSLGTWHPINKTFLFL